MTNNQPRIGRPPLPAEHARSHRVHLRLTDAEMTALQASLPAGVPLTSHVRDLALTASAASPQHV